MRDINKKLGVALVGLGEYSSNQLAPALHETKMCKLAGVVTGSKEKGNEWRKKYKLSAENIYNYQNFDSISDNPDIDIVYVVLPNALHAEYTIRAAKAGKHVIVEKPMAMSVEESERMIEACENAGVNLFVGYRLHFEPFNKKIMKLGEEKVFGRVQKIHSGFGFEAQDPDQWRLKKHLAGGGALMDVGIYCIQAARYSSRQEPVTIKARIEDKINDKRFISVEGEIFWEMEFPDGTVANCEASYARHIDLLKVQYEEGWAEVQPAYYYHGQKGKTNKGPIELPQVNQQALQLDGMSDAILNNKKIRSTGEEGLQDMRIIEAIYKSAYSGKKIKIPELVAV